MKFTSLDAITRSVLIQRKLPIHYYLQYLKHAADCFQELHFDTLRVVNTRILPVTGYGAVALPEDFVDFVKIGVPLGQMVKPLHQSNGLNRLHEIDEQGNPVVYPEVSTEDLAAGYGINYNDNGENIGRYYGFHNDLIGDTYKVLPERCEIQLNQALGIDNIILEYISDGTYCDACTQVDTLAKATIEDFMKWQESPSADNQYSPEGKKFYASLRKLRARKSGLTAEDIKRTFRASVKPIK